MTVTLYSGPGCMKCRFTQRKLESGGVNVQVVHDPDKAIEIVNAKGLRMSLPVVVANHNGDEMVWSDIDLRSIENVVELNRQAA